MNKILILISFILLTYSCKEDYTPKPRAYFRIDIPEYEYIQLADSFAYTFEYADYADIEVPKKEKPNWINIYYPKFKARIYISHFNIDTNLNKLLEDAHEFAYKHITKANDITPSMIHNKEKKMYGLIYNIKGAETATPINFYITDSTDNFFRASLYFNFPPNNDSTAPIIRGIENDIAHLINTFEWK